jgi:hypothetical protein
MAFCQPPPPLLQLKQFCQGKNRNENDVKITEKKHSNKRKHWGRGPLATNPKGLEALPPPLKNALLMNQS